MARRQVLAKRFGGFLPVWRGGVGPLYNLTGTRGCGIGKDGGFPSLFKFGTAYA
jgi:hypothetical protein